MTFLLGHFQKFWLCRRYRQQAPPLYKVEILQQQKSRTGRRKSKWRNKPSVPVTFTQTWQPQKQHELGTMNTVFHQLHTATYTLLLRTQDGLACLLKNLLQLCFRWRTGRARKRVFRKSTSHITRKASFWHANSNRKIDFQNSALFEENRLYSVPQLIMKSSSSFTVDKALSRLADMLTRQELDVLGASVLQAVPDIFFDINDVHVSDCSWV